MSTYNGDYENFRDANYGLYAATDSTDSALLAKLFQRDVHLHKYIADAAANESAVAQTVLVPPVTIRCLSATVTADSNVAADNTDYISFNLGWIPVGGGPAVLITEWTTSLAHGNITANIPYTIGFTYPSANWIVPAGATLAWSITKGGAGKVLGVADIQLNYELMRL